MSSTPEHLLEILSRVRAGKHLGGGDVPGPSLQSDIALLLALRLIEPDGICPYRLTEIGAQVLNAVNERSPFDRRRPGSVGWLQPPAPCWRGRISCECSPEA